MNRVVSESELKNLLTLSSATGQLKAKKHKKNKKSKTNISLQNDLHDAEMKQQPTPSDNGSEQRDPISDAASVHEAIIQRIARKNRLTLGVSGLPVNVNPSLVQSLIPDFQTVRIKWNALTHRCTGVVYVEFGSEELVDKYKHQLAGMEFHGKRLDCRTGQFLPEDINRYEPNILVLHGLHPRTHTAEIAKRFPFTTEIKIVGSKKRIDKKVPTKAVLTFPTAEAALTAFDARQKLVLRKNRIGISWFLKKQQSDQPNIRKCLCVRGLSKAVTESDLRTIFPQASSIKMHKPTGEAFLYYDLEEDCVLDRKNAAGVKLHNRKLQINFGHSKQPPSIDQVSVPANESAPDLVQLKTVKKRKAVSTNDHASRKKRNAHNAELNAQ